MKNTLALIFITLLFVSCTSKSPEESTFTISHTGYLFDRQVVGAKYFCDDDNGDFTGEYGDFVYESTCDELVFKVGNITFGRIKALDINADDIVYVHTISGASSRTDLSNKASLLVIRFIQSLDYDLNVSNGIRITQATFQRALEIQDIDITNNTMNEAEMLSLLESINPSYKNEIYDGTVRLRDTNESVKHLIQTMNDESNVVFSQTAPYFDTNDTLYIKENDTLIDVINVYDVNNDNITLSLSGANGDKFTINQDTKELYLINPYDYEADGSVSIDVTIVATDDSSLQYSQSKDITVVIQDIDDTAPIIDANEKIVVVDEQTMTILKFNTQDIDSPIDSKVEYILVGGSDLDKFELTQDKQIRFKNIPFYSVQSSYELAINIRDVAGNISDTPYSIDITVLQVSQNYKPILNSSYEINTSERALSSTDVIHTVDATSTSTYSLSYFLEDTTEFIIDETTGVMTSNLESFDYERQKTYGFTVVIRDEVGNTARSFFIIEINDINDEYPIITSKNEFYVDENNSFYIADITAIDADAIDTNLSFSIEDSKDSALLYIDEDTGKLSLVNQADVESSIYQDKNNTLSATLKVTDLNGNSVTQDITIKIYDLPDMLPIIMPFTATVYEDIALNTTIGNIEVNQSGLPPINQYHLSDESTFYITNKGELKNKIRLDFEKNELYELQALAYNEAGTSNEVNVTITVLNTIDAQPQLKEVSISIDENKSIGDEVFTIVVLDKGEAEILSYELNDTSFLEIDEDGLVKLTKTLDYETQDKYFFSVTASNKYGQSEPVDVNITVNDYFNQTQVSRLNSSDASSIHYFGSEVEASNDFFVASAIGDNGGSAYIFKKNENDIWEEYQKIIATDKNATDNFGQSIAIYEDTIVIGANQKNNAQGAVYVFDKDSFGVWNQTAKIVSPNAVNGDNFGQSVDIYDEVIAIGAHMKNNAQGEVYTFTKTQSNTWEYAHTIVSRDIEDGDNFGNSLSLYGDMLIISAYNKSNAQGAAYEFKKNATEWTQYTKMIAKNPGNNDQFGCDVSLYEKTLVVGVCSYDDGNSYPNIGTNAGSAYVYEKVGNSWTQMQELKASDAKEDSFFGSSVSIYDKIVTIGAYGNDSNGTNSGAAYIYKYSDDTWNETRLVSKSIKSEEGFGNSVSVFGYNVIVGVSRHDKAGQNSGMVNIYDLEAKNNIHMVKNLTNMYLPEQKSNLVYKDLIGNFLAQYGTLTYTISGQDEQSFVLNSQGDIVSSSVALDFEHPDDMNEDNVYQITISVSSDSDMLEDFEQDMNITIYDKDIFDSYVVSADPEKENSLFGSSVIVFEDTMVVGARTFSNLQNDKRGAIFVYEKNSDNQWIQTQDILESSGTFDDNFGCSLAYENGTLFIGANGVTITDVNVNISNAGVVYAYEKNTDNQWTKVQTIYDKTLKEGDKFGSIVGISNGRLAVTATDYTAGTIDKNGAVFVFEKNTTSNLWESKYLISTTNAKKADTFSYSMAISGDTLLVGAPFYDVEVGMKYQSGSVFVFEYNATIDDWQESKMLWPNDNNYYDHFGWDISMSNTTAIVGAPDVDFDYKINSGAAYILQKDITNEWFIMTKIGEPTPVVDNAFGSSVYIHNDIGVIGAPYNDSLGVEAGYAYLFKKDETSAIYSWTLSDEIIPSSLYENANFGYEVFMNSDEILVSAPHYNNDIGLSYYFGIDDTP